MSWTQHIRHPSKLVNIADDIEVVVLRVNADEEKISLGLKQTEPDPWETLEVRFPITTRLEGKVRNLTNFGAFVEIEPGIDGLVHISDMSWTKRIRHPSEVLQKGQEIEVVVLGIDRDQRRISLGFKQAQPNPWEDLSRTYEPGTETTGKITRFIDKGVIVDIPDDVEGFVPLQHLGREDLSSPEEAFEEGDELPLTVIEFDRDGRKIVLSVTEYFKSKDVTEQDAFIKKHEKREITLADHEGADGLAGLKEALENGERAKTPDEVTEAEPEPAEVEASETEAETEEPAEVEEAEAEAVAEEPAEVVEAEEPVEVEEAEAEAVAEEPAEVEEAEAETAAEEPAEVEEAEAEAVAEEPAEVEEAEAEAVAEEPAEVEEAEAEAVAEEPAEVEEAEAEAEPEEAEEKKAEEKKAEEKKKSKKKKASKKKKSKKDEKPAKE